MAPSPKPLPRLSEDDWQAFTHLILGRHHAAPLVIRNADALDLPGDVARTLRAEAGRNARDTLGQIGVTREIVAALRAEGIEPVVMKGWPMAERLYGAAGHRRARDIDLVVPPEEMPRTAAILGGLGYVFLPDHAREARLIDTSALRDECHAVAFMNADASLSIELHWRTNLFPGWPDLIADPANTMRQQTGIGPVTVPAPAADLIYLAGHGARHLWTRLKWLADVAWLAERRGAEALEEDLARARAARAWFTTAHALGLAHRLMQSPLPPSLARPTRRLVRHEARALALIADPKAVPGEVRYKLQTNLAALRLAESVGQVGGVLRYAVVRRLRLGMAGLSQRTAPGPAK